MRCTPYRQTLGSLHSWGPSEVPSTRLASPHVRHATVTRLTGTRERAPDPWACTSSHLLPQHWPGVTLPHPGVPGGGASVVGGTPNLPLLHLPLALTSWPHHAEPPQSARLVGATGGVYLFCNCFPDSPWSVRGPLLSKGHLMLLPGRTGRLGPPSNSAPVTGSHPRALCSHFRFSMMGSHLGIFSLTSQGPGSLASAGTRTSVATGATTVAGALTAESGSSIPSFFQWLLLLPGPIGGCPSLGPSSPCMNPVSQQWTPCNCII